jgi:hypothetical protein
MKTLAIVLVLMGPLTLAQAAYNPAELDQMTSYADNAILDAAQGGRKVVILKFGRANVALVERLSDDLRARGYRIDEEAAILNPEIVKIFGLKISILASR